MIRNALRRLACAGALGLAALCAAPASGQTMVTYPPSRALADLAAWLQRDTPLAPSQIVDISPAALTAITSAQPMGQTRGFLANISSEAVDPEVPSHEGIASWSIPVEVDCERRQVRLGAMTGYRSRDLRTDPQTVRDADTGWVNPIRNAPLGAVIRALCDRDFKRPLIGPFKGVAQKVKASPPPAAPAEPAPRSEAAPRPALRPALTEPSPAKPPAKPVAAPAGGGSFTVQIGASPSKPDTEALLAKFKKKYAGEMGGHSGNVASLEVDGKPVNRALISGFASAAEAGAFCKTLSASGQACFIRR